MGERAASRDAVPLDALGVGAARVREGLVVAANRAAVDLLAITPGQPLTAALPPSERPAVEALLDRASGSATVRLTTGVDLRAVELQASPHDGDVIVTVRDVTEALRQAAIVRALGDATTLLAADGHAYWGTVRKRAVDRPSRDVTGEQLVEWTHPEDLPVVLDLFSRALAEPGLRATWESRWRYPDAGRWAWSRFLGYSGVDDPDLGGIVLLQVDERIEARSTTTEREQQFLSLAELAPVGILVGDARGHVVYRNPLARDFLCDGDDPDCWTDSAVEGDRDALRALWKAAIEGDEGSAVVAFDICDGTRRWLQVTVVPQSTAAGDPAGAVAALLDVTDAVLARRDADRMLHVLDTGSDFVMITAPDSRVLQVNNAALYRLGLDSARPERTLRDALTEPSREQFDQTILPIISSIGSWIGELEVVTDDGSSLPLSIVAVAEFAGGEIESLAFVGRDISLLKATEEKLRKAATHDHLTGLANRTLLFERLQSALAMFRRHGHPTALLFCDLDGFKGVNDTLGHDAGDLVLRVTSDRLRRVVRASDTVARIGGDEFVVLCEQFERPEDLAIVAARITEAVSEPIDVGWDTARVGVSIGIAVAGPSGDEPDALLSRADARMYDAKRRGKGNARTGAPA